MLSQVIFSFAWQGHHCCEKDCSFEWTIQVSSHLIHLRLPHTLETHSGRNFYFEIFSLPLKMSLQTFPSAFQGASGIHLSKTTSRHYLNNTTICIAIMINILCDRHIQIAEYIYFTTNNMILKQHSRWSHENHRDETKQLHVAANLHNLFLNSKDNTSHESVSSLISQLSLGTNFHKPRGLQYSGAQESSVLYCIVKLYQKNVE